MQRRRSRRWIVYVLGDASLSGVETELRKCGRAVTSCGAFVRGGSGQAGASESVCDLRLFSTRLTGNAGS